MSETVAVLINGQVVIEYDRSKSLTDKQQAYLNRMDQQMNAGVTLAGETIIQPDQIQRAKFVANALVQSIQSEDEPRIAATCSYLAERLPGLKQIRVDLKQDSHSIDLIFDQEFRNQIRVDFDPLAGKTGYH